MAPVVVFEERVDESSKMKLTRVECCTYLCLLARLLTPSEQVSLFDGKYLFKSSGGECQQNKYVHVSNSHERLISNIIQR